MFHDLLAEPMFVLTGDQDWTPEWALAATLDIVAEEGVPFHLFVTNRSSLLSPAPAGVTLGIHPNFLPLSSHGSTEAEVIATCLDLVPGGTSFRSHAFHENSRILGQLCDHGFVASSNLLCFLQPDLIPLIHPAGLIRFPVVFEDDTFLASAQPDLDLTRALKFLFTPGLKVLNFHPSLVALNAPTMAYHDARRDRLFGGASQVCKPYHRRGAADVMVEIIRGVHAAGFQFISFPALVAQAYASLARALHDDPRGWPSEAARVAARAAEA